MPFHLFLEQHPLRLRDRVADESKPLRPVDKKRILAKHHFPSVRGGGYKVCHEEHRPQLGLPFPARQLKWQRVEKRVPFIQMFREVAKANKNLYEERRNSHSEEMPEVIAAPVHCAGKFTERVAVLAKAADLEHLEEWH